MNTANWYGYTPERFAGLILRSLGSGNSPPLPSRQLFVFTPAGVRSTISLASSFLTAITRSISENIGPLIAPIAPRLVASRSSLAAYCGLIANPGIVPCHALVRSAPSQCTGAVCPTAVKWIHPSISAPPNRGMLYPGASSWIRTAHACAQPRIT